MKMGLPSKMDLGEAIIWACVSSIGKFEGDLPKRFWRLYFAYLSAFGKDQYDKGFDEGYRQAIEDGAVVNADSHGEDDG